MTPGGARAAGALSRRRLDQLARLDPQGAGAGRGGGRRGARAPAGSRASPPGSRPSSTSAPSCRARASTRAGARFRRSTWSRRSRNCCAPRRPRSRTRARAGRCWSAARSAIRAAPPRWRPGWSPMGMPTAWRPRSSTSGAARPRIVLGDDAMAAIARARADSRAHMSTRRHATRDAARRRAALLDQGRRHRSAVPPAHGRGAGGAGRDRRARRA